MAARGKLPALGESRPRSAAQSGRSRFWSPACSSCCLIGENPLEAPANLLLYRRLSAIREAIGYTLYYATSFIFTGLAVAVAFHCRPVQHRRRGPGLCRRLSAWRSVGSGIWTLAMPTLVRGDSAGDCGRPRFGAAWAFMCPAGCRPSAAATSSSPPSCSISSPPALMVYLLVRTC